MNPKLTATFLLLFLFVASVIEGFTTEDSVSTQGGTEAPTGGTGPTTGRTGPTTGGTGSTPEGGAHKNSSQPFFLVLLASVYVCLWLH